MLRLSIVLMLLLGSPARAAVYSGNTLLDRCNDNENVSWGACLGYITAVSDVLNGGDVIAGWKACNPKNVTPGQARDIVVRWLEENPKERHYSANSLVAIALSEAFPCP